MIVFACAPAFALALVDRPYSRYMYMGRHRLAHVGNSVVGMDGVPSQVVSTVYQSWSASVSGKGRSGGIWWCTYNQSNYKVQVHSHKTDGVRVLSVSPCRDHVISTLLSVQSLSKASCRHASTVMLT